MALKNKLIIVTGGAGFIGSHIVDALSPANDVIVLDDFSSGKRENLLGASGVKVLKGSVTKPRLLKLLFRDADYVFHLAARPSVPASVRDPKGSSLVTLGGTLNVLMAAHEAGVKKVIFSSSCAVYGDARPPVSEMAHLAPKSPYAIQKLGSEHYCRIFHDVYGMRTVCLRYFNVFGPRQDPASQYAAVIPVFFRDLAAKGSVTIYGDGKQTRDFIFVDDVVKVNILAAENSAADGNVLNIATGKGTGILDLAGAIAKIVGKPLKVKNSPARDGDILHSRADVSLAKKLLGFRPKTELSRGLRIFSTSI